MPPLMKVGSTSICDPTSTGTPRERGPRKDRPRPLPRRNVPGRGDRLHASRPSDKNDAESHTEKILD